MSTLSFAVTISAKERKLRVRTRIFAIAMAMLLTACGTVRPPTPQINWGDERESTSKTRTSRDEFKKQTIFVGPDINSGAASHVFIRAWKPDSTPMFYQIYAHSTYTTNWRFYNSAYDSDGNVLETTVISRKVDSCGSMGCIYEEDVGMIVKLEYLERRRNTGLSFKIFGNAGEELFFIPAGYIRGFLSVAK